jgi:hypothetical protein
MNFVAKDNKVIVLFVNLLLLEIDKRLRGFFLKY